MNLHKIIFIFVTTFWFSNVYAEDAKVAYIFAGYNSSPSKALYQEIGNVYLELGVTPIYVEIDWSFNNIENYVSQARTVINKYKGHKKYFYGFSLGGLIALSMASEFGAEKVVVSSTAPFFNEDINQSPWYSLHKIYNWWLFGNNKSVSLDKVIEQLNGTLATVILLVGAEEEPIMLKRNKYIGDSLVNGKYIIMENIAHGLSQPGHIHYVESALRE